MAAFGGHEGIPSVRQAIDHLVDVILEAPVKVHAPDLHGQGSLPEELLVVCQGIEPLVHARSHEFRDHPGSRLDLDQRPNWLANGHEPPSWLEQIGHKEKIFHGEEPSLSMPALGPWVGKVYMKRINR